MTRSVSPTRLVIGGAGVLLGLFGVFRLVTQIPTDDLTLLVVWLVAALVLHDGVLSPVVVGVGWVLARVVPPRARRYLQVALIVGALITVIALPMIHRQGTQPPSKAILRQDYGGNLAIALSVVAVVVLVAYAVSLVRSRGARTTKDRPDSDQHSSSS